MSDSSLGASWASSFQQVLLPENRSADGRMATEAARLERKQIPGKKKKNRLDTNRPSHGRTVWFKGSRILFRNA
jgi:hypothetical protein